MAVTAQQVRKYYENNTKTFLALSKDGKTKNIHQALWAEGVNSREEAVSFSNELMLRQLDVLKEKLPDSPMHVLDLGCGVGSSLMYLAEKKREPNQFTGISISPTQIQLAQQAAKQLGLDNSCDFIEGDFQQLPDLPPVHLGYAIEAFLHAPDSAGFFQEIGKKIVKGGRLALVDDFLTEKKSDSSIDHKKQKYLREFQSGWLAGSLISVPKAKELAEQAGFRMIRNENLTPFMEIGRPRDKFIGLMIRVAGKWMRNSIYFQSLTGGYAKQQCLKNDWVNYRFLVFEKVR